MNSFGWLEVCGITLAVAGMIICLVHIQYPVSQVLVTSLAVLTILWVIFAYTSGLPIKLQTTHSIRITNGVILFGAVLVALIVLVGVEVYTGSPVMHQWWFWAGAVPSWVASARLCHMYSIID